MMRAPGLLVGGLAALVVGIVGLLVATPLVAGPTSVGPMPAGTMMGGMGSMMGMGPMMGSTSMTMGGMGTMMGGPRSASATPISLDDAIRAVEQHLEILGDADLAFDKVEVYVYNFYVPVYEQGTGAFAFEVLVDRYSGSVMPEPGPNMMWNTKYGMMATGMMPPGGMMGPGGMMSPPSRTAVEGTTVDTPITEAQAVQLAQQFLDGFLPGSQTGDVHTFYGYRTIHVERDGQAHAMLSVNGYDGAVWYHTWHGDFLEEWHRPGE